MCIINFSSYVIILNIKNVLGARIHAFLFVWTQIENIYNFFVIQQQKEPEPQLKKGGGCGSAVYR